MSGEGAGRPAGRGVAGQGRGRAGAVLTGLLMLWMSAGEVRGQAAQFHAEYLHHNVYTGGQTQPDSANGVDVSIDGTAFAAVTRNNAGGTQATARLVMTNDNGTTTLNFAAIGSGDSAAHAVSAGIPAVEFGVFGSMLNTGYLAGTYESGMSVTIVDPNSTATTSFAAPSPGTGSGAFVARCLRDDADGLAPLGAAFAVNGTQVEFLSVNTAPCWNNTVTTQFDPQWNVIPPYFAVGGYVSGDSQIDITGHMYLPGFGYRTGTVGHDPTNTSFPTLALSGSSEAGMVVIFNYVTSIDPGGGVAQPYPLLPGAASLGSNDFLPTLMLIDGVGNDRVLDVQIDPRSGDVVICGYYSSNTVDFNPDPGTLYPSGASITHAGGKDMFVAKYNLFGGYPILEWLFVHGTSGDDMANAVAIDSDGSVYVAGTTHDSVNGMPGDIFVARIKDPAGGAPQTLTTTSTEYVWNKVYAGTGIDTAEDVTIDHLNRPVFTGQFGYETSGDVPLYFLNFDPAGGSGATVFTHGGSDAYLLRLRPDHTSNALLFDFALAFGDNHDEVGTGVAPNPYNRGELVHCGSFGSSFSTTAYGVDFDPSSGTDIVFTAGKSDPFVNRFDHFIPCEGQSFTVMLDVSNSMRLHFEEVFADVSDYVTDSSIVPQTTGVKFSMVAYSIQLPVSTVPESAMPTGVSNDLYAQGMIPWTTIDATTAPLLERRIQQLLLPQRAPGEDDDTGLDDALYLANYLTASGQCLNENYAYTSACFIADQDNIGGSTNGNQNLETARNWAVDSGAIDQTNSLCVLRSIGTGGQISRSYAIEYASESKTHFTTSVQFEDHLGFANNPDDVYPQDPVVGRPLFQDYLTRFLRRMSHCPGDYDLDGTVEPSDQDPTADKFKFLADFILEAPYADWNIDGGFTSDPDVSKFNACLTVGCGN